MNLVNKTYLVGAVDVLNSNFPLALVGQPFCSLYLLLWPKVLVHIMFPRHTLPVVSDLCSLGEFFGPLCVGREARLVYMGRYITSHAGVGIFEPVSMH